VRKEAPATSGIDHNDHSGVGLVTRRGVIAHSNFDHEEDADGASLPYQLSVEVPSHGMVGNKGAARRQTHSKLAGANGADVLGECMGHHHGAMQQPSWFASPQNCMSHRIPFWQTGATYRRVKDCFQRYCLTSWLTNRGLAENNNFWTDANFTNIPNGRFLAENRGLSSDEILLHPYSVFLFADAVAATTSQCLKCEENASAQCRGLHCFRGTDHVQTPQYASNWSKPRPLIITLDAVAFRAFDSEPKEWLERILDQAVAQKLPPSTLVYMNGDASYYAATQPLLDDPRVGLVLATNPQGLHDKLDSIPLGVKTLRPWAACLDGQEAETSQRDNLLFCDGYSAGPSTRGSRRAKIEQLQRNGFKCEVDRRVELSEYCADMLHAKFVASPHGIGALNYREFEALAAGAVPLIDHNPNNSHVYDGLPVIQVKDWSSVTKAFLETEWVRLQAANARGEIDRRKLYAPYWLSKVVDGQPKEERFERMRTSQLLSAALPEMAEY
jgi:hypothetical protein